MEHEQDKPGIVRVYTGDNRDYEARVTMRPERGKARKQNDPFQGDLWRRTFQ